jgi:glyoxylase-like metal-dependent hydrolase (beta-lactamase superfamily II)
MKRVAVLVVFVLALAGLYQRHVLTEPGMVRQLAPGVWTRIGDNNVRQPANTSWIEFKDFVVVIDANTPWGAQAVLDEIKKTTSKPIKYVFDTHYHWDHTQGNSVLADSGVTVICSQDCANELRSAKGLGEWASMSKRTDQYSLAPYRLQPPSVTFGDFMMIDDGERRLELRKVGPGHTIGDAVAVLAREGILFTGDLCVNWTQGNNVADRDADIPNWAKILLDMAAWTVTIVVPGHGEVGTTATLRGQSAFLSDLWTKVSAGKKAGKTVDELVKEIDLSNNGNWAATPAQNASAIRAAYRKAP